MSVRRDSDPEEPLPEPDHDYTTWLESGTRYILDLDGTAESWVSAEKEDAIDVEDHR